jgi:hypothetical protein
MVQPGLMMIVNKNEKQKPAGHIKAPTLPSLLLSVSPEAGDIMTPTASPRPWHFCHMMLLFATSCHSHLYKRPHLS